MDKLLDCKKFTKESLMELLELASKIKAHPENYTEELKNKVIAVMFLNQVQEQECHLKQLFKDLAEK